jgi:RHS repeat-associated protein
LTRVAVITTTDYAGNYIYQNNALQMINQPEGYLEPNGLGTYDYGYRLKDHLGNIRLTFVDYDNNGSIALTEITEENNYYPFGLKHQDYNDDYSSNRNAVAAKFKYNGKELNDELDLDLYDYGARFYDAALGRWHVIDPLADKYPNASPYCYALNNPITYIDPDGREVLTVSTAFTASFGGSAFREKGVLFDFSGKNVQIYRYKTNGFGTETNASLAIEGLAGYYPTATAQDLAGFGTIKNFSAGEVLFGSTSQAITSNGKKGVLVGVGFNIGALPFAYGEYSTNTTISPYNQSAKEYALLTKAISRGIETIDAKLDSFNNEIGFLNKGIGRTSQAIQGIDSKLMNSNLSEEARLELIQERSTLYNAREGYFKRGSEIQQTTSDLKSQREQLNELLN